MVRPVSAWSLIPWQARSDRRRRENQSGDTLKVLLVGNSQAACIKRACDLRPGVLSKRAQLAFQVTPGGDGPYFTVENDRLSVISRWINPKHPPTAYPEGADRSSLSSYEAIVVSALGYVDGGFCYKNPIQRQGQLHQFLPRKNVISDRPISAACFRQIVFQGLLSQPGISFLSNLRSAYQGRIIVQPFPLVSDAMRSHADWPLSMMYSDPIGAHSFFCSTGQDALREICSAAGAELLPYPRAEWLEENFTPAEFMNARDGIHPNDAYGLMVCDQLARALS